MIRGYYKRLSQKAQKLSREQLISLVEDLAHSNEDFDSIMESISSGILILDWDFILKINNALAESYLPFNVHLDESKAFELPVWEIIEDEDISRFFKKSHDKQITNSTEDFSVLTPGGSVRFITITLTPLVNDGNLTGRIVLIRDITEKKNQDILLRRMENLAHLTNLAAGLAHEIKNPLGAISIHIQLLQKAVEKARENQNVLPPKKFVEDHIDVVNEEIDHLNRLVMDFLFAVRPVKATLELKNPDKIIKSLVDFITAEFSDSSSEIILNEAAPDCKIMIDEKLFRDVILNMAQNSLSAIKSRMETDRSEGKLEKGLFSIKTYVDTNKYFIKLKDNGCGMSGETLEKLFEPYYTTKANGTGLGMTMAYKVIKEFSGDIQVTSQEGEGTEFTISFPLPQKDKKLLEQAGE